MTRCLDEARLQSYFDGELSIDLMESVTSHLASCVTCAAAARELEEETALLTTALSAEFEASVPTETLRQRIEAAVMGERVAVAQATEKRSGLAAFFSGVLNFGTQRTLGLRKFGGRDCVWSDCRRGDDENRQTNHFKSSRCHST